MSADVFISYSSKDLKIAQTICAALEARGFGCWYSGRDVKPGADFAASIVETIRSAKVMLFIFSENSNRSEEVLKEVALASRYQLPLIPLRIEDIEPNPSLELQFATRNWIDFFLDWEYAMEQLTARISGIAAPTSSTATTSEIKVDIDDLTGHNPGAKAAIGPQSAVEACISRGDAYAKIGQNDMAIGEYNDALRLEPRSWRALHNRGNVYQAKGEIDLALVDYSEAIKLNANYTSAYNNRGNAYLAKGDTMNALADFDQAMRLDPTQAIIYNNRGVARMNLFDYAGAIDDFTAALRLKPDFALALTNRAKAYEKTNQFDLARRDRATLGALAKTGTGGATPTGGGGGPPSGGGGMKPWLIITLCIAGCIALIVIAVATTNSPPSTPVPDPASADASSDTTAAQAPDPAATTSSTTKYEHSFRLYNESDTPIAHVLISEPGKEVWSDNLLPDGVTLENGYNRAISFTFNDQNDSCTYDVVIQFANGQDVKGYGINLCGESGVHVSATEVSTSATAAAAS